MSIKLRLYTTLGSPPSSAVMATLEMLNLPYEEISLDYMKGEHLSVEHEKRNPQKEIPVLEDNGFFLSESVAIMQYLCDRYGGDEGEKLYPTDHQKRALVNHRMMFNVSTIYKCVTEYIFGYVFGWSGQEDQMKKACLKSIAVFETILSRQGTSYAAGDCITIGDISLTGPLICLESKNFDMTPYPNIVRWYTTVQSENPKIWKVLKKCVGEMSEYFENPPPKSEFDALSKLRDAA